jgi:hypothetical protein
MGIVNKSTNQRRYAENRDDETRWEAEGVLNIAWIIVVFIFCTAKHPSDVSQRKDI